MQSARKRRLSQLVTSSPESGPASPLQPSQRSRSGSVPVEPLNRKLFSLVFQADPSLPSTLSSGDDSPIPYYEDRLNASESDATTPVRKRRFSLEPKHVLERTPGVSKVAEELQKIRCKDLEREIHELRLENDFLRDDNSRIRSKVQDLQALQATALAQSLPVSPSKRESLTPRERDLLREKEKDDKTIAELLSTIMRMRQELEEAQTAASINEGLLKLAQLDEFTKTIEEKERIILELQSQVSQPHNGLRSSMTIFPPASDEETSGEGDDLSTMSTFDGSSSSEAEDARSLRERLEQLSQVFSSKESEVSSLQERLNRLISDQEYDQTELKKLQEIIQLRDERIEFLETTEIPRLVSEIDLQLKEAQEKIKYHESVTIPQLQNEILESQKRSATLQLELEASVDAKRHAEAKVLDLENNVIQKLRDEISLLKTSMTTEMEQQLSNLTSLLSSRDEKILSFSSENESLRAQLHSTTRSVDELEANKNDLLSEIAQVNQKLEETKKTLSQASTDYERARLELALQLEALEDAIAIKEDTMHVLEHERIPQLQKTLEESSNHAQTLQRRLESLEHVETEKKHLEEQIDGLRYQLESIQAAKNEEMSTLAANVARLEATIDDLRSQNTSLDSKIDFLSSDIKEKDAEARDASQKLQALEAQLQTLIGEKGTLQAQINLLNQQKAELSAKNEEQAENLRLAAEMRAELSKTLETQATSYELRLKEALNQSEALEAESATLKTENTECQSRIAAAQAEILSRQQQYESLTNSMEALISSRDALEAEKRELEAYLASARDSLTSKEMELQDLHLKSSKTELELTQELKSLQEKLEKSLRDIASLEVDKADLEHTLSAIQSSSSDQATVLSQALEEKKKLSGEVATLSESLAVSQAIIDEIKQISSSNEASLRANITDLEAAKATAANELLAAQTASASLQATIQQLENDKKHLGEELKALGKELEALRRSIDEFQSLSALLEASNQQKDREIELKNLAIEKLRSENQKVEELEKLIEALRVDYSALLAAKDAEIKESQEATELVQSQLRQLDSQLDELENQRHEMSTQLADQAALQQRLADEHRKEISRLEAEVSELLEVSDAKLQYLETELEQTRAEAAEKQAQLKDQQARLDELIQAKLLLEQNGEEQRRKADEWSALHREELASLIKEFETHVAEKDSTLALYNQERAEWDQKMENFTRRYNDAQALLEAQLKDLQDSLASIEATSQEELQKAREENEKTKRTLEEKLDAEKLLLDELNRLRSENEALNDSLQTESDAMKKTLAELQESKAALRKLLEEQREKNQRNLDEKNNEISSIRAKLDKNLEETKESAKMFAEQSKRVSALESELESSQVISEQRKRKIEELEQAASATPQTVNDPLLLDELQSLRLEIEIERKKLLDLSSTTPTKMPQEPSRKWQIIALLLMAFFTLLSALGLQFYSIEIQQIIRETAGLHYSGV